jgi:hypothetical protein
MPWVHLNKFIEERHRRSGLPKFSSTHRLQVQRFAALCRLTRQQLQRFMVVTGFDGFSYYLMRMCFQRLLPQKKSSLFRELYYCTDWF